MSCLRMHTCCFCLNTARGSIAAAISSIAAGLTTFIFIILGLVYWDEFSEAVRKSYHEKINFSKDSVDFILKVIWWGNIFTLIVILLYVFLCILMIIGVKTEQYKHMIPWITSTCLIIPFFSISFIIQLIFGIVGISWAVIVPALVVLLWCAFWLYGLFCAISHYRVLKGDIHRPVSTLWKR
ncbi:unnamed protein product [Allacma fusca]|uniref:Transmembrane protein n=1 Tax=Allacma fusca TaxID=39272 RepID=A0A8J2KB55_9HEXA|nr:unnamed protein product [Allacma fusca]